MKQPLASVIDFGVSGTNSHYHVPLLVSPFGYTPGVSVRLCTGPLYHAAPLAFSLNILRDKGHPLIRQLLRDLESPTLWKESYHVPTWVEYVRHNLRRTHADAEISDRLVALNKGGQKPRVRRMIERDTVPPKDDLVIKPYPEIP